MTARPTGHALIVLDAEYSATIQLTRGEAGKQFEADILPAYLMDRRWYGAKDAGAPTVRVEDAVEFGADDDPVLLILDVAPPGQASQKYLLPILVLWDGAEAPAWAVADVQARASRGVLVDAFADDRFVRSLLAEIRAGEAARQRHPSLIFRRTAALIDVEEGLDGAIERSTAEQSNTSMRIGGTMLKAFRKLEPGIHPELEMARFLTERARFGHVPALLGSVEHVDGSGSATTLCVLQALVPNQGDGWTYAVDRLKRALGDEDAKADLFQLARQLGKRTAELHHVLAMPTEEEAFAPEPLQERHLSEWIEAVRVQARGTLNSLEQARPGLDPVMGIEADRLIGRRQDLVERIGRSTLMRVEARRTRLHGDYHLGQVLVSDGAVFIIDFEGEPLRPLADRRAKHSPLKDVAGMLRSFAYASAAAERDLPAEERAAVTMRLSALAQEMSTAFLDEYGQAIQGCPSFPGDTAHAAALLRLFLLEKALYEVSYELANRPEWLSIPLAGVLALLDETDPLSTP